MHPPMTDPELPSMEQPSTNRETRALHAPPPRSTLRPPPPQWPQGTECTYAPTQPSPLAHASDNPLATQPLDPHSASQADSMPSPYAFHPPPPSRQLANLSADRSSACPRG